MFCIRNPEFISVRIEALPLDLSLLHFSHLEPYLSSCLLDDGPGNSRCTLPGRAHICAPGINFCKVRKDRKKKCQII